MSNVDINHARALVYQLLSSLFAREIDEQRLKQLTSEQAQQFWTQLGYAPEFSAPVVSIQKVLNDLTSDAHTDWGGGVSYHDTLVQVYSA